MDKEVETAGTGMGTPKRGRPRAPYCPDCKKAGRPDTPKAPGQGYCKSCMTRRQRDSRRAGAEGVDLVDAREKNFRDEIEALRSKVEESQQLIRDQEVEVVRLRRTLVDPKDIVPSELESAQVKDLRKEVVLYKSIARGLLHDLYEVMPDKYGRDDPKWDF